MQFYWFNKYNNYNFYDNIYLENVDRINYKNIDVVLLFIINYIL